MMLPLPNVGDKSSMKSGAHVAAALILPISKVFRIGAEIRLGP